MKKSAAKLFLGLAVMLFALNTQAQPGDGPGDPLGCDCPEEFEEPVCVIDEMGNVFAFPSECIALCLGFEVVEGDCGLGWEDGNGGGDPDPFECDCDESEFSPVCILDEMGNINFFPNECIAICLGLPIVGEGDCDLGDGNGNGGGDPLDCNCSEDEFSPVCVVDELGNILLFPSECIAACLGLEIVGDGDCDLGDGNGGGDPDPLECDCDPNDFSPVCVIDEMGNIMFFPSECIAACLGLEIVGEGDCDWGDGNGGGDPDPLECDCDPNDFSPVCVIDEFGYVHLFPSECIAACLGLEIVGEGDCDWGDGNGGGDPDPFECDCDPNEFSPVCVIDEMGNISFFPSACLAACIGLEIVGEGDCDWGDGNGGGDPDPLECDCDPNDFSPVCVIDEFGYVHLFPNECIAACLGLEIVGEGDCDWGDGNGGGDPDPFECDCDPNEFSLVCVVDEMGNEFVFPSECLALCLGLEVVEGDCGQGDGNGNGGGDPDPFECDCDPNEFSPVCVIDELGNVFSFPSECVAICLGFDLVDGDCEDIFEDPNTPEVGEIPQMSLSSGMDASDMFGMVNLVSLYPNPASKNFNLNINASNAGLLNVEILNLTGQRVFSSSWQAIDGVQQVEIDIENLESGIYLVRVSPANGNPVTEKFIKR